MRPKMLNLTDVVADMHLLLRRISGDLVKLERHHARDLWPVMADIGQFEQVVTNLVQNARDAMPEGGRIDIATRNVPAAETAAFNYPELTFGDYVLVEVSDTGSGMPAEVAERIFEPFFTTKEIGKGTGLGLSMVYGIIKQSGGFIYVDSRPGEGTTFRIFLPRHVPAEVAHSAPETLAAAAVPAGKLDLSGTATILLVEDEDHVRAGNVRALKMRGYDVHEASSGVEALAIMEELGGRVDLVVSDVMMPEMDGPTLLRELLAPLDARARALLLASAKRVSVVTAVSPRAIVDLAFVFFETVRLIRRMSELYGARPGTLGLIRLTRDVLAHLAVTGTIALGDGLVQQVLGQGLAQRLSAKLGEGVVNGLLTARVGLSAMDICRPMPFMSVERPGVGAILRALAASTDTAPERKG